MDIEGAELRVFETYKWEIHPTYIAVETHDTHNIDGTVLERSKVSQIIQDILINKGYELIYQLDRGEGDTEELQFINKAPFKYNIE